MRTSRRFVMSQERPATSHPSNVRIGSKLALAPKGSNRTIRMRGFTVRLTPANLSFLCKW